MKKTLIVFAGKRGTTREAAGRLAAALNGASTLNLAELDAFGERLKEAQ